MHAVKEVLIVKKAALAAIQQEMLAIEDWMKVDHSLKS